jgi:hypothetical protein
MKLQQPLLQLNIRLLALCFMLTSALVATSAAELPDSTDGPNPTIVDPPPPPPPGCNSPGAQNGSVQYALSFGEVFFLFSMVEPSR